MAEVRWRRFVGPIEVVKLSVGQMDNNVYVLKTDDEALLVDGSDEADAIMAELGERKLTAIVQTHDHYDHVQALPALVQRTEAPVYVHPEDADGIPVEANDLREGETLRIGRVELRVLHTPGHTPGGICLVMSEDGQTLLFAGDTLFPDGPGGTFGNADAFAQIMDSVEQKLFTLDDDTQVLPGHGADTTIGDERPKVASWRARGW